MSSKSYKISVIDKDEKEINYPGMCDTVFVKKGELVKIVTTGGGGWGDPLKREPEKVLYDLKCGIISEKSAKENYGVYIFYKNKECFFDFEKTIIMREEMIKKRGKIRMFDRGKNFKEIETLYNVIRPEGWKDSDNEWFVNEK